MPVPQNGSPGEHAIFVWKNYVMNSGFESIILLAHSAGGECVKAIQTSFSDHFYSKVKQIAFTDSWVIAMGELNQFQLSKMREMAIHYIASDKKVGIDVPVVRYNPETLLREETPLHQLVCRHVSAGHLEHAYTTASSWPEIEK